MKLRRQRVGCLRPGQHGTMNRHDLRSDLSAVLLCVKLANTQLRRGQQHPGRGVGRVFQAFAGAKNADEHLNLVVVGRDVVIADRPVQTRAEAGARLEVVGTVAQGNTPPVIGAPAHHPLAPPAELRSFAGVRVGLARDLPAAVNRAVVETVRLVRRGHTAQRRLTWQLEHRRLGLWIEAAARLQHQHLQPRHGQRVSGLAAASAGADDDDVVGSLQLIGLNDGHGAGRKRRGVKPLPAS